MSDWKKLISDAKELLDLGAITDAEFEEAKRKAFAVRDGGTTQPPPVSSMPNFDDMGTRIHSPSSTSTSSPPSFDELGTMVGSPDTIPSGLDNMGAMVGQSQPETIGSYRIVELLGQGGMGSVYKGKHKNDQVAAARGGVAIKMIHPSLATDEDFKTRFVKEGLFGMSLQHPNIANVIDVVDDGGVLALLMDFVEGQELKTLIPEGGMSVDEVVRLLKPIASALDYLHEQGIVHRDMKPANVRVKPDGTPIILDFGIAKDTNEVDANMTQTGTAMGTQTYMAPEQMDAKRVTGAADQYALAMMAYQMLSGKLPWKESLSSVRITMAKMMGELTLLDGVNELSKATSSVVMKGLNLRSDERYSTCVAFVAALDSSVTDPQSEVEVFNNKPEADSMSTSSISLRKGVEPNTTTGSGDSADVIGTSSKDVAKPSVSKDEPPSEPKTKMDPNKLNEIVADSQTKAASESKSQSSQSTIPAEREKAQQASKGISPVVIGAVALVALVGLVLFTSNSDDSSTETDPSFAEEGTGSQSPSNSRRVSSKWSQFSNVDYFQTLDNVSDVKAKLRSVCQQDSWHKYSTNELKLIRNAIFAIRGRQFKTDFIREYFSDSAWYDVDYSYSDSNVTLSSWEKRCVKDIKGYE